nr:unnamed protein product [Digitaria exilis]
MSEQGCATANCRRYTIDYYFCRPSKQMAESLKTNDDQQRSKPQATIHEVATILSITHAQEGLEQQQGAIQLRLLLPVHLQHSSLYMGGEHGPRALQGRGRQPPIATRPYRCSGTETHGLTAYVTRDAVVVLTRPDGNCTTARRENFPCVVCLQIQQSERYASLRRSLSSTHSSHDGAKEAGRPLHLPALCLPSSFAFACSRCRRLLAAAELGHTGAARTERWTLLTRHQRSFPSPRGELGSGGDESSSGIHESSSGSGESSSAGDESSSGTHESSSGSGESSSGFRELSSSGGESSSGFCESSSSCREDEEAVDKFVRSVGLDGWRRRAGERQDCGSDGAAAGVEGRGGTAAGSTSLL